MKHIYRIGALAVVSLIAAGAVAGRPMRTAASEHSQFSGRYEASYTCCADFTGLTKAATVVVRARVVAASPSYLIPYVKPVVVVHPPAQLPSAKATMVAHTPPAPLNPGSTGPAEPGIVATDFTIKVLDTLRGAGVKPGQSLTVFQVGGTDPRGQQVVTEGDPLFQVGQEEILFLGQDPTTGKYSTVAGPQGRFAISPEGTVQPLDPHDYPYTQPYSGLSVAALKAAVQAIS